MRYHALTCIGSFNTRLLGAVAAAATLLAPVYAHAQSAPMLTKALTADGYYANSYPPGAPFRSWLDILSTLKEVGYDDAISIENEDYSLDADTAISTSTSVLKFCIEALSGAGCAQ